jgi:hypothetical protein
MKEAMMYERVARLGGSLTAASQRCNRYRSCWLNFSCLGEPDVANIIV